MEAVVAFEPSPQLSVLLGKEGGRCTEKPLQITGISQKKPTTKPGITSTPER